MLLSKSIIKKEICVQSLLKNINMDDILLSIILVTYNAEDYILTCLESIINQKQHGVEFIVVDGLSSDNTVEIINDFKSHIDVFIREQDSGIYDAMNKGIRVSHGEWLYFIGADDKLEQGAIETFLNLKKRKNIIYYGNVFYTTQNRKYDGKFNKYKIMIKNICHQAIFYPKSVFEYYNFDLNYPISADQNLNIQLFGDKNFKFKYFDKIIAQYSGDGLSTRIKDNNFIADKYKVYKKNLPLAVYYIYRVRLFITSQFKRWIINIYF